MITFELYKGKPSLANSILTGDGEWEIEGDKVFMVTNYPQKLQLHTQQLLQYELRDIRVNTQQFYCYRHASTIRCTCVL